MQIANLAQERDPSAMGDHSHWIEWNSIEMQLGLSVKNERRSQKETESARRCAGAAVKRLFHLEHQASASMCQHRTVSLRATATAAT
jgi:hypothetical protein